MQRKYAEYRKKPDKTPEEQYKEKADMWGREVAENGVKCCRVR